MAAKDFIVAIELGSSKMTGIAGKKNLDGSINILAVVKEDSSSFIHKGVVYNLDKTVQALNNIITRLTSALKTNITRVYVGVGGQSIRSVNNIIALELPAETKVTPEMVIQLMDTNRNTVYPDQEILDAAVQEYGLDAQLQVDPVGIQCRHLEGSFMNIIERKTFYKNLNDCFTSAGIKVADMYLAPIALADSVLTESEKRSGCVLVDLGSDTTTVSVYDKNILRHLAVIPLGGSNITKDIASLQMDDSEAEHMKLKYGSAWTDNNDIDDTLTYAVDDERSIPSRVFIEVVEARLLEIIENVWAQVPSEYYSKLLGGIILTGGGSNMKNIEKAFRNHTHIDKIRIAKFVSHTIHSNNPDITAHNAMMNTVLGLLAKGDMNCAGGEADLNGNLFGTPPTPTPGIDRKPRQPGETALGVVITSAEKEKAEEEARAKKEEEERMAREAEAEEKRRRKEERRKNGAFSKFKNGFVRFAKKFTEEEE